MHGCASASLSTKPFMTTLAEHHKCRRELIVCEQNDIQMVSILYRTHRGLSTGAKVASLYAFDALARAARNQVAKNHITGDLASGKGNCATFLLRIEGILDGLYRDLVLSGSNELKVSSDLPNTDMRPADPRGYLDGPPNLIKT